MKSRLSSQIWTLAILNGIAFLFVLGLAINAGRSVKEGGSLLDAVAKAGGAAALRRHCLGRERSSGMEARQRYSLGLSTNWLRSLNDWPRATPKRVRTWVPTTSSVIIAENLNRAVATRLQGREQPGGHEALQRSITDLLAVINQVAGAI